MYTHNSVLGSCDRHQFFATTDEIECKTLVLKTIQDLYNAYEYVLGSTRQILKQIVVIDGRHEEIFQFCCKTGERYFCELEKASIEHLMNGRMLIGLMNLDLFFMTVMAAFVLELPTVSRELELQMHWTPLTFYNLFHHLYSRIIHLLDKTKKLL